jgi:hypothetical protein
MNYGFSACKRCFSLGSRGAIRSPRSNFYNFAETPAAGQRSTTSAKQKAPASFEAGA